MELNPLCQAHELLVEITFSKSKKKVGEALCTIWGQVLYGVPVSTKGACWRTKWVRDLPTLPPGPTPIQYICPKTNRVTAGVAAIPPPATFYVHGAFPSHLAEKSASPARQQAVRTHWATPSAARPRHPSRGIPSCIRNSLLIFVGR